VVVYSVLYNITLMPLIVLVPEPFPFNPSRPHLYLIDWLIAAARYRHVLTNYLIRLHAFHSIWKSMIVKSDKLDKSYNTVSTYCTYLCRSVLIKWQ
jgi:hypothetical protein